MSTLVEEITRDGVLCRFCEILAALQKSHAAGNVPAMEASASRFFKLRNLMSMYFAGMEFDLPVGFSVLEVAGRQKILDVFYGEFGKLPTPVIPDIKIARVSRVRALMYRLGSRVKIWLWR